jgi:DNA-binding Xre family transcriptional regulator
MQTYWKLDSTLRQYRKTPLALARASGLSKTTVYNIVHGKAKGIELETLDKIMLGLEQLTGQKMQVEDVLNRESKTTPALEALLKNAKPFDSRNLEHLIPDWTLEEEAKNDAFEQSRSALRLKDRVSSTKRQREFLEILESNKIL